MTTTEKLKSTIFPSLPTVLCCLFLVIDFYEGWLIPGLSAHLTFIGIFYWALFRPDLLSPIAIFLAATTIDLISFRTVGATGFLSLALFAIIILQRHFFIKQTFLSNWGLFTIMLLCHNLIILLAKSLGQNSFTGFEDMLTTTFANCLYTTALFPLMFSSLYKTQTFFIESEK